MCLLMCYDAPKLRGFQMKVNKKPENVKFANPKIAQTIEEVINDNHNKVIHSRSIDGCTVGLLSIDLIAKATFNIIRALAMETYIVHN